LTELFNRSLTTSCVPAVYKAAYISPRLKKVDLDSSDVRSYRPISNLSVLSKQLERLIARQRLAHLNSNGLLPRFQSAVLKVLTDILLAVDAGDLSALVLLDLSAAFNTVDHGILLHRLDSSYQIVQSVQQWFQSYLYIPVKQATARANRIFLITQLHSVWCTPGLRPWCQTFPSVLRRPAADH